MCTALQVGHLGRFCELSDKKEGSSRLLVKTLAALSGLQGLFAEQLLKFYMCWWETQIVDKVLHKHRN